MVVFDVQEITINNFTSRAQIYDIVKINIVNVAKTQNFRKACTLLTKSNPVSTYISSTYWLNTLTNFRPYESFLDFAQGSSVICTYTL